MGRLVRERLLEGQPQPAVQHERVRGALLGRLVVVVVLMLVCCFVALPCFFIVLRWRVVHLCACLFLSLSIYLICLSLSLSLYLFYLPVCLSNRRSCDDTCVGADQAQGAHAGRGSGARGRRVETAERLHQGDDRAGMQSYCRVMD